MVSLNEYLTHYKDRIQKNPGDLSTIKHVVEKLKIDVTADAITKTGVYKVVRDLAKTPGPWTNAVTPLYNKWRSLLLANQNNSSKTAETEIPSQSQSDVSKNLYSERVKSSNLHNSESPKSFVNKPVVTNGAKYPTKSSDAQESIYSQNKCYKSSENEKNKDIVINGENYSEFFDTERNFPTWNRDVKPSENQASQAVMNKNDAYFSGKSSHFEEKGPTWSRGKKPPENHTNWGMEISNDANYPTQFGTADEIFSTWNRGMKSPENPPSNLSKIDGDNSTYFAKDETGISKLENGPFGMMNGFHHNQQNPSQGLGRAQNHFKSINNIHPSMNNFHPPVTNSLSAHNIYVHNNFEHNQNLDSSASRNQNFDPSASRNQNFDPSASRNQNFDSSASRNQNFDSSASRNQNFDSSASHNQNFDSSASRNQNFDSSASRNQNSDSSASRNTHSANALSPRSSKNPADTGNIYTASPNKMGRLPNPYEIEMKEGMFRTVKSYEGMCPDVARVKSLYNQAELREGWDYAPKKSKSRSEEKVKSPIKDQSISKSSKVSSEKKNSEKKSHSSKSKNTPEKLKGNARTTSENTAIKSEKRKSDSAIENSQCEKRMREESGLLKTENSNSSSPPESRTKDNLSPKINLSTHKEGPMVSIEHSNIHKSNISKNSSTKLNNSSSSKESKASKSDRKGNSPIVVSIRHVDYAPIHDDKKASSHKICDKVLHKGRLSDETTEKLMFSKKERTNVYSGKKSVQEFPTLRLLCVQMLKKTIESIRYTYPVPYEQLKPVLTHFTASRLKRIEENNPYLLQGTDELWKSFCKKKFPDVKPVPPETWRMLYWKTREKQDKKLKEITANISASMSKAAPERKTKLAVIESPKLSHKRMKLSEPKTEVTVVKASSKETLNHKNSLKESISSHSKTSKEYNSSNHKKNKKAPVAPLMSKVKRTLGIALHKK